MTIGEIREWQRKAIKAGSKSVAIGGYQFISKTFDGVVRDMNLSDDTIFSADVQDNMGMHLLNRRGYSKWMAGQITDSQFGDNLAMEWASLPRFTGPKRGASHYAGDGLNKVQTGIDIVQQALAADRNGKFTDFQGPVSAPVNARPGLVSETPAERERRLKLASVNPTENYTGADLDTVQNTQTAQYRSRADDRAAEQAVKDNTPTFWEGAGLAVDEGWISTNVLQQLNREDFAPDRDFQFNEDLWEELTVDLPPVYQEALGDAVSEPHARAMAEEIRREFEIDQQLGGLGVTGAGLRIGAALLDPIAIAASVATEGVAAPVIYSAKVGKVARFLRAGAAAGAVNAGIEGYLESQNPLKEWENVGYAAAAGFVLGGALGAFGRTFEDRALTDAIHKVIDEVPEATPQAARGVADGSVGAARVPTDPELNAAQKQQAMAEGAPFSALRGARIDVVGILKQSENPITRKLAGFLAEDAVGNADGSVVTRGASENVARESRVRLARFYRTYDDAFKDWAKEQGVNWYGRGAGTRARFNREVGMAVRRDISEETNAHVNKVATQLKKEFKSLLDFGREKNIRGFNEVNDNINYMTRRHRIQALDDLVEEYGSGPVHQLVAKSLMDSNRKWMTKNGKAGFVDELEYEDALGMAQAYIKSIRSRKYGQFDLNRALSGADEDTLKMMLQDAGMDTSQMERIVSGLRASADNGDKGRISEAKWRLNIDETTSVKAQRKDGSWADLSIEDFIENDAELLFTSYTRSVLGAGYLEEAMSNFKIPNAAGELPAHAPSYETVKAHIAANSKLSQAKQRTEFARMDKLYKAVQGVPIEPPSGAREALRFLRDYNFIRIGGQLGVAQLAEIGNIVGNGGLRVMVQHMPALKGIYRKARSSGFSDEFYNEIEAIWGFGTDLTRSSPHIKMDDVHGGTFEGRDFQAGKVQQIDHALQQGKIVTSVTSGMAHINMALQRFNARVLVQRFMDNAQGSRAINAKRFAVMGIDEAMTKRITQQMRKHVTGKDGMLGRKVQTINIERWDDIDAKNHFINGVDRWAKKSIQENDVGNMPSFMSYDLAKTIMQFRSFMTAAYTKQLLSGIHHRDWETFSAAMTSMFFGGLFYTAQTTVNAQGRDDKDEYLDEKLSPPEIAKASFQRAGFSSFIPMAVDTSVAFGGMDPVFSYRTSGLSSSLMSEALGNPSFDLLQRLQRGAQGATSASLNPDYNFSQRDLRNLTGALFFQNAFIVRNIIATFGQDLPRFSS
ncbi:hypothetical protein [uncultured Roseobacter sp.]|uniref:hypothetical protein n=1 Tax=uncultured Roseobacter sp. TaxID=114847 RepID=UPI0026149F32|nr:hypothetical protein [uncultured Roseobacter sp.]